MKKLMKRLAAVLLITLCLISSLLTTEASGAFDTQIDDFRSDVLLLMSIDDGTVVIEKNSNEKRAPAALLGIATVISAIENCDNLEAVVEVKQSVLDKLAGLNSTTLSLKAGERIRLIDLLYGIMLTGASDAALAVADYIAEDIDGFVRIMNELAQKAGCKNTNFANVHGLDDDAQYTTAYDLALITLYALKNSHFDTIAKSYSYKIPETNTSKERALYTTNLMMNSGYPSYYNSFVKGIRTGTTSKAGRCVITTAAKDGYSYLAVAMNAPAYDSNNKRIDTNYAFIDCNKMLTWTFKNIKLRIVASPNSQVTEIKLNLADDADYLRLVPESEITALVPSGVGEDGVLIKLIDEDTAKEINAPVEKGDVLGKAQILYANSEIATVNLVAAESYKRSNTKYLGNIVKKILFSKVFIVLFIITAASILFYIFAVQLKRPKKNKNIKLVKGNSTRQKSTQQKQRPQSRAGRRRDGDGGDDDPKPPKSILR